MYIQLNIQGLVRSLCAEIFAAIRIYTKGLDYQSTICRVSRPRLLYTQGIA